MGWMHGCTDGEEGRHGMRVTCARHGCRSPAQYKAAAISTLVQTPARGSRSRRDPPRVRCSTDYPQPSTCPICIDMRSAPPNEPPLKDPRRRDTPTHPTSPNGACSAFARMQRCATGPVHTREPSTPAGCAPCTRSGRGRQHRGAAPRVAGCSPHRWAQCA
eukprot:358404-Chlamydomonas_euryale.AAC.13